MMRENFITGTRLSKGKAGRFCQFRFLLGISLMLLAAGCALKSPPGQEEIQQQALKDIEMPADWQAGSAAGKIADNWLASFDDKQLSALVDEAVIRNPDLRVSAA